MQLDRSSSRTHVNECRNDALMICSLEQEHGCIVVVRQPGEMQLWVVTEAAPKGSGIAECTKHDCLCTQFEVTRMLGLSELDDGSVLLYIAIEFQLAVVRLTRRDEDGRMVFGEVRQTATTVGVDARVDIAPTGGACFVAGRRALNRLFPVHEVDAEIHLAEACRSARLPADEWTIDEICICQGLHGASTRLAIAFDGERYFVASMAKTQQLRWITCSGVAVRGKLSELAIGEVAEDDELRFHVKLTIKLDLKLVACCWLRNPTFVVADTQCVRFVNVIDGHMTVVQLEGVGNVTNLFSNCRSKGVPSVIALTFSAEMYELEPHSGRVEQIALRGIGFKTMLENSDWTSAFTGDDNSSLTATCSIAFRSIRWWGLCTTAGLFIVEVERDHPTTRAVSLPSAWQRFENTCPLHVAPARQFWQFIPQIVGTMPLGQRIGSTSTFAYVLQEGFACEEYATEDLQLSGCGSQLFVAHDLTRCCDWFVISCRTPSTSMVLSACDGVFQPETLPGLRTDQPTLLWQCFAAHKVFVQVTSMEIRTIDVQTLETTSVFELRAQLGNGNIGAILHAAAVEDTSLMVVVVTEHHQLALDVTPSGLALRWQIDTQPDTHIFRAVCARGVLLEWVVTFSDHCQGILHFQLDAATGARMNVASITPSCDVEEGPPEAVMDIQVAEAQQSTIRLLFVLTTRSVLSVWKYGDKKPEPEMIASYTVPKCACNILIISPHHTARVAALVHGGDQAVIVTITRNEADCKSWVHRIHAVCGFRSQMSTVAAMMFTNLADFAESHAFKSICLEWDGLDAPVNLAALSDDLHFCLARVLPWVQRSTKAVRKTGSGSISKLAFCGNETTSDVMVIHTSSRDNSQQLAMYADDLQHLFWRCDSDDTQEILTFTVTGSSLALLVRDNDRQQACLIEVRLIATAAGMPVAAEPEGACVVAQGRNYLLAASENRAFAVLTEDRCQVIAWTQDEREEWVLREVASCPIRCSQLFLMRNSLCVAFCEQLIVYQPLHFDVRVLLWDRERRTLQETLTFKSTIFLCSRLELRLKRCGDAGDRWEYELQLFGSRPSEEAKDERWVLTVATVRGVGFEVTVTRGSV